MFRTYVLVALALLSFTPGIALAQRGRGGDVDASKFGWLSSLSQGKAAASKSGKPLMVVIRCVP